MYKEKRKFLYSLPQKSMEKLMNEINQEDLGNRGVKILRRAFEELDNLIKENWRSFTCHQIASIYHDFLGV